MIAFLGVKTLASIWHLRLCHPQIFVTQRLVNVFNLLVSNSINKIPFCLSCQLAKYKKLPFHHSTRQSPAHLHLIHLDVWQSPIISNIGFKYYVLFVDDYLRFTWLLSIKQKSYVFTCFLKFKWLAETQLSCKIKSLQTDGGGEYTFTQFRTFS